MCHFHTGNADEGSQLYRNALQVLTDSKCMPLDDNVMEKMIDLPELLHLVGRPDSLKESLDKYSLQNQRRTQETRERAELLERANGESSHVLRIFNDEAQAMQSARSSARMLA
ncbi:Membrin-12 [Camellia lanceoleosa]|uniref:Membrin-12 n=1 Tax=Camellia lanceoleosa TaxID=1840588 RepID=A0ACC0F9J1_9ERIC|nr:Membrin-12 [Camellia lanceoleosa]